MAKKVTSAQVASKALKALKEVVQVPVQRALQEVHSLGARIKVSKR